MSSNRSQPQESQQEKNFPGPGGDEDDIVSIHRRALHGLFLKEKDSANTLSTAKMAHLTRLRRQRIGLAAKVAFHRQQNKTTTVSDVLLQRKRAAEEMQCRPFLSPFHRQDDVAVQGPGVDAKQQNGPLPHLHGTEHDILQPGMEEELAKRDFSSRMRTVRRNRNISAAYRLAGISLFPCDDNENNGEVMALRLDIAVDGRYVECYNVFFELALCQEEGDDLCLRLVQHSLPPSVPLSRILKDTLGGDGKSGAAARIGPLSDETQWRIADLKVGLRNFSNSLYQACYCHAVRSHAFQQLRSLTNKDSAKMEHRQYTVTDLSSSESWDKISFTLKLLSGTASLLIDLTYQDPMRCQPTTVTVTNAMPSSSPPSGKGGRRYSLVAEISDDDDNNNNNVGEHDDLIESATVAFRRLPVEKAIDEVAKAMGEW